MIFCAICTKHPRLANDSWWHFCLLGCFGDALLWSYPDLTEIQLGVKTPTPCAHTCFKNIDVVILLFKAGIWKVAAVTMSQGLLWGGLTVVSRLPGVTQDTHIHRGWMFLRALQTKTVWKSAHVAEFPAKSGRKYQSVAQNWSDSVVQMLPLVTALPSALFWEDSASVQVLLLLQQESHLGKQTALRHPQLSHAIQKRFKLSKK